MAAVTIVAVGLLSYGVWTDRATVLAERWELAAWLIAMAVVGFLSLSADMGVQFALDLPLALAASFLFGPAIGGALAFLGYTDRRELRREVPLLHAIYNRAQTSLSVLAAGTVFILVSESEIVLPVSLLASVLALATDCVMNYGLVIAAKSLHERERPIDILRGLRLGPPGTFVLSYLAYGLLSVVLVHLYLAAGAWALSVFLLPLFLARQTFEGTRKLQIADSRLTAQSQALREVSSRVADERRDERLAVAAGLHDEVLPPLFNVHLAAQVIRQDLASGRLMDLEEDVPTLIEAVEAASEAVRSVIRGLRNSPLGSAGFRATLELLVDQLRSISSADFVLESEDIEGPPLVQLLAYQVVREALNNAVRHSGASAISVWVRSDSGALRVIVEDDGKGFSLDAVDRAAHFGLSMMRERVELVGGILHVESDPGRGTRVIARLPIDIPRG